MSGDYEGKLSDCCGAVIIWGDICSACKEHCEPQEDDEAEKSASVKAVVK